MKAGNPGPAICWPCLVGGSVTFAILLWGAVRALQWIWSQAWFA